MDLRKTVSWLALFVGVLFLVIGAATAHAGDYDDEYVQCKINCGKNPGAGRTYQQCVDEDCAKYDNVTCLNCNGCTGGGFNIPCDKSTNSVCGDANPLYCKNGLCYCDSLKIPGPGGDMYSCYCKKP